MRYKFVYVARTYGPSAIFDFNLFAQLTRHNGFLTLEASTEFLLLDDYIDVSCSCTLWDRNIYVNIAKLLLPFVRKSCKEVRIHD